MTSMKKLLTNFMACSVAILPLAAAHAAEDAAAIQARLTAMSPGSQVHCQADKYGNPSCKVDDYRVEYSGCDVEFGAIKAAQSGVELQDNISGHGGKSALLHDRQFVCIMATARDDHGKQRFYVMAPPTAIVPECKGKSLCRDGDQAIWWIRDAPGPMCHRDKAGQYAGECAAGWVDAAIVDEYSNGL